MATQAAGGSFTDQLVHRRNAALLLVGFFGAFRAAELAQLRIADAVLEDDGLIVTVRQSKTDQQAVGQVKVIPRRDAVDLCGPCAWAKWRQVLDADDTDGHVAVLRALRTPGPADLHHCHGPGPTASPDPLGLVPAVRSQRASDQPRHV